jgi:two-component system, NtrC family, response regulator AtoC
MSNLVETHVPFDLMGSSPVVIDALAQVDHATADERGVLITAESGLDGESVARAIHARSARRSAPFLHLACDGAGAVELERSLFGTQHRSATAELELVAAASALFRANGGVLFLSALNELPAGLQRRLARMLRDGEARMPKRNGTVALDVRVIGATENRVDGMLRDDLVRRLPLTIDVPPLRQRRDDIPVIAEAMVTARDGGRRFTPAALTVLAALPWRRNTAELAALIDRLTAVTRAGIIRQEDVLAELQLERTPPRPAANLREARRQFERDYIASVLRDHAWQMRDAARALGIERANLYRKARQLGIPLRREADASRVTR